MNTKTILITGATDGIGLLTAETLLAAGHRVLVHGRSQQKLAQTLAKLGLGESEGLLADLARPEAPQELANQVRAASDRLDVLINNAGVFSGADNAISYAPPAGIHTLDSRFIVNTIAPYALPRALLDHMPEDGRVVNVASAAQAPVQQAALRGERQLSDGEAYAQSKLAIIMWSRQLAREAPQMIVSVNPASMLGSKMVKQAYGVDGADLGIGADILTRAALSDEFADANGKYYDNDSGRFAAPHPAAQDLEQCARLTEAVQAIVGP